jgi:SAM-dependent methyltransferase
MEITMSRVANAVRKVTDHILPRKEYVEVSGSVIVAPHRRLSGLAFKDNDVYIQSSEREAHRLIDHFQCTRETPILDVGCGQGRLAIGLIRVLGKASYTGIDIDPGSVKWCRDFIERQHPTFKFMHFDLYNERYNPGGTRIDEKFRFDVGPASAAIAYLFSVFSHTTEEDMRIYLEDFKRVLSPKGKMFFTTFVEEDCPDFSINPPGYRLKCSGPLHIVRYKKTYLFSILAECGYSVLDFTYGTESDGQSAIYLGKSA